MAGPFFQKYSLVPRGGRGLACDAEGLVLGPLVLAKRVSDPAGNRRYRVLSLEDMAPALRLAYGPIPDTVIERCCRGLVRVAQLLGAGEDALASIYAVQIGFPEIAPDGMAKLAAASLRKYNPDWEDEPRVPAGNPDGGQWTSDGGAGEASEGSAFLTDVAYQGTYHDQVVGELAAHWKSQGAKVITSVSLTARNGATARADLIAIDPSGGGLTLFEVKTGNDPQYTGPQRIVYPMAQIGDHVYSSDPKIGQLGFAPGQWLPSMRFFTIDKQNEQSTYLWIEHPNPMLP